MIPPVMLLLADRSPCLRYRVLTELVGLPDSDAEVKELKSMRSADPLVPAAEMWRRNPSVSSTAGELRRLGYLGFDESCEAVRERAEYLFSLQKKDGSWPLKKTLYGTEEEGTGYSMVPLQTAIPLIGLSACGYSEDRRVVRGYEWLLSKRLDDGVWPTGRASGVYGRVAGYRKLPHTRWGCRSNTTAALLALSGHDGYRRGPELKRAVELLLAREKFESANLGFEIARGLGAERTRGFFTYFARSDPGLVCYLGARFGFSRDDRRINDLRNNIEGERSESGLWRYNNSPQVSRWVSFFLIKSLNNYDIEGGWTGEEPRTPFQEYGTEHRRW